MSHENVRQVPVSLLYILPKMIYLPEKDYDLPSVDLLTLLFGVFVYSELPLCHSNRQTPHILAATKAPSSMLKPQIHQMASPRPKPAF